MDIIDQKLIEDRIYKIGEISQATGLQKTANGWVKPKSGKTPGANKEKSGLSERMKYSTEKTAQRMDTETLKKHIENLKDPAHVSARTVSNRDEVRKVYEAELAKRNGGTERKSAMAKKEDLPDFIKGFSIVSEEHDQETRAANAKLYPSLQPLVRQREPFMKKRIEAFTKLRDNPGNPKANADFVDATNAINEIDADIDRAYKKATSNDAAPKCLTGDCKIRVKKEK